MVKWEGIEDTGVLPTRIWLSRPKLDDENAVNPEEWQPLRKVRYLFTPLIISENLCVFYLKLDPARHPIPLSDGPFCLQTIAAASTFYFFLNRSIAKDSMTKNPSRLNMATTRFSSKAEGRQQILILESSGPTLSRGHPGSSPAAHGSW